MQIWDFAAHVNVSRVCLARNQGSSERAPTRLREVFLLCFLLLLT